MNVTIDNLEIRSVTLPMPSSVPVISFLLVLAMIVYIFVTIAQLATTCRTPQARHVDYYPSAPLMDEDTML